MDKTSKYKLNKVSKKKGKVIGITLLAPKGDRFYSEIEEGLFEEAKKYEDNILVVCAEYSIHKQIEQINDFITKKVDAIIICPCDSKVIGPAIARINRADIPAFTMDIANMSNQGEEIAHISSYNEKGGKLAGELLLEAMGYKGKVAIINHSGIASVDDRVRGFRRFITEHSNVEIVADKQAWGQKDKAIKIVKNLIKTIPDIKGIFAVNDNTALGALEAIESAEKLGQIIVVGYDATPELRMAIAEGKIYGAVKQYPYKIGQGAIRVIHDYFEKGRVPSTVFIDVDAWGISSPVKIDRESKKVREFTLFSQMKELFASRLDLDEILMTLLESLVKVTNIKKSAIHIFDEETRRLRITAHYGLTWRYRLGISSLTTEKNIFEELFRERKAYWVIDVSKESRFFLKNPELLNLMKEEDIYFLSCLPLIIKNKTKGIIILYHNKMPKLNDYEIERISAFAFQIALAIENGQLEKKSKKFADFAGIDNLTQLYNRKHFEIFLSKEISQAERFGYPFSLAIIDVDYFKRYNDTYGHLEGDIALKEIAKILRESIRAYDLAARYGGDEMVLIMPHTGEKDAFSLLSRVGEEVTAYQFKGNTNFTLSIGLIAVYPKDAQTKSKLLKKADEALYRAKQQGRNRICSSKEKARGLIKFGFCQFSASVQSVDYYVLKGAREIAENIGYNIELITETFRENSKQRKDKNYLRIIRNLIEKKIDALAIPYRDGIDVKAQIKRDSDVPIFIFNAPETEPFIKGITYIGYDQRESGRMMGRYIVRLLRSKGRVVIFEVPADKSLNQRKQGFMELIKDYPDIKIVSSQPVEKNKDKIKKVVEKILHDYPDADAFYIGSDEIALEVVEAIKYKVEKNRIFTVSIDGVPDAFKSIKDGFLTATLCVNPIEMGRILMRNMVKSVVRREEIAQHIQSPLTLVDLENITQYLPNCL